MFVSESDTILLVTQAGEDDAPMAVGKRSVYVQKRAYEVGIERHAESIRSRAMAPCERAEDDQLAEEWRSAFAAHGLDLSDRATATAAYLVAMVLDGKVRDACARENLATLEPALLSIDVSIFEALAAICQFLA